MNQGKDTEYTIQDVAKLLGIGSKVLFDRLRDEKIIYRNGKHNVPYQNYIERGYFTVQKKRYKDWNDNQLIYPRTYVTNKGIDWLESMFNEDNHHVTNEEDLRRGLLKLRNDALDLASQLIIHEKRNDASKLKNAATDINTIFEGLN